MLGTAPVLTLSLLYDSDGWSWTLDEAELKLGICPLSVTVPVVPTAAVRDGYLGSSGGWLSHGDISLPGIGLPISRGHGNAFIQGSSLCASRQKESGKQRRKLHDQHFGEPERSKENARKRVKVSSTYTTKTRAVSSELDGSVELYNPWGGRRRIEFRGELWVPETEWEVTSHATTGYIPPEVEWNTRPYTSNIPWPRHSTKPRRGMAPAICKQL